MKNFPKSFYEKLKKFTKDFYETVTGEAYRYLSYTYDDFAKLLKNFLSIFEAKIELSLPLPQIIPEDSSETFTFSIDARTEVIEQTDKHFDKLIAKCRAALSRLKQSFEGYVDYVRENFGVKVINPLMNALERAEKNYKMRAERLKETASKKNALEKMQLEIENKIEDLEREMKELIGE